jgi:hypothetical protein
LHCCDPIGGGNSLRFTTHVRSPFPMLRSGLRPERQCYPSGRFIALIHAALPHRDADVLRVGSETYSAECRGVGRFSSCRWRLHSAAVNPAALRDGGMAE